MVLICPEEHQHLLCNFPEFPSPCGDYGSYHTSLPLNTLIDEFSFRPLAGIMVLIMLRTVN